LCFLAELDEGHAFAKMCGLDLETFGVNGKDLIEFGDGLIVLFLFVGDFAEIELGIGSELGVAVKLQIVLKFLAG